MLCLALLCSCSRRLDLKKEIITTSFYPVYVFTKNLTVGIDGLEVVVMSEQNTGCLHDYTLTTGDMRLFSDSSVLVINGAGMEAFLQKITDRLPSLLVIDSSRGIELLCEEEHSYGHSHEADEEHSHCENAHFWLSVPLAMRQTQNIADALCAKYPQFCQEIQLNCKAYLSRLRELNTQLSSILKGCEAPVISFHEAFDYLADSYCLTVEECIGADHGTEPAAKDIARLCDAVRQKGIRAVLVDTNYQGSAADIISRETGVPLLRLSPVTSGDGELDSYERLMLQNADIIYNALNGGKNGLS